MVGVRPDDEKLVRTWWNMERGSYLSGANDAIIGTSASELLNLNPGDSISISGTSFTIVGVLGSTGANDDYQIFTSLSAIQQATGKEGKLSTIDIRALCNGCPVVEIVATLNKSVTGIRAVAVQQVAQTEVGMLATN